MDVYINRLVKYVDSCTAEECQSADPRSHLVRRGFLRFTQRPLFDTHCHGMTEENLAKLRLVHAKASSSH